MNWLSSIWDDGRFLTNSQLSWREMQTWSVPMVNGGKALLSLRGAYRMGVCVISRLRGAWYVFGEPAMGDGFDAGGRYIIKPGKHALDPKKADTSHTRV